MSVPFDAAFYLAANPDIAAAGVDPLAHFLSHGRFEGRAPHALFDAAFYLSANPDVAAAGLDPLAHYVEHGWREGRAHHPLFDAGFYRATNPDVAAAGADPLAHYIAHGGREGRAPHPAFDAGHYLASNPDVAAADVEPLSHFLAHGRFEGRAPHALFDAAFYLSANPDVAAAGVDPLAHYVEHGRFEGRAHHPLFDPAFYLAGNADVAAAGADAFEHFMRHGWREGRDPSAAFSLDFYAAANPDVAAAGVNMLVHYVRHGQAEGRAFQPGQLGIDGRVLGADGDDTLVGDFTANRIEGLAGDDTLIGGIGNDTLIGGPDGDLHVLEAPGAGVDRIQGFAMLEGDALDLRAALAAAGFDAAVHALGDFVRVTASGADTLVAIRPPGGGAGTFQTVARLQGVTATLDDLRYYGVLTEPSDAPLRLIDSPLGFIDTVFSVDSAQMTPDGRYAAWADLQNDGAGGLDHLTHLANLAVASPAEAQEQRRLLVSVDNAGAPAPGARDASIADDGRTVSFVADGVAYVRAMDDPDARPVAVGLNAQGAIVLVETARLSGDGGALVFVTTAAASAAPDRNSVADVYLRDLDTGETRLVSAVDNPARGGDGAAGGGGDATDVFSRPISRPDLSGDGRHVVFVSDAALTADDDDDRRDVYLRDMDSGKTLLLSGGAPGEAFQPTISRDGTRIAFTTDAALDGDDGNGVYDIYVTTVQDGTITARTRVSESESGVEAPAGQFILAAFQDGGSYAPVIAPDGSAVAFMTSAPETLSDGRIAGDGSGFAMLVRDLDDGGYGAPATPAFFPSVEASFDNVAAATHDLSEGGDTILYRIPLDLEDSLLKAPVEALAGLPDVGGGRTFETLADRTAYVTGPGVLATRHGAIDAPGDVDRFLVRFDSAILDAPRLRITLEGDDRWGDGLTDPLLTVRSAEDADVILFRNDDRAAGQPDSRLVFSPGGISEGFFIDVEGAGGAEGDYTLRIEELAPLTIVLPPIVIDPGPVFPSPRPIIPGFRTQDAVQELSLSDSLLAF